MTAATVVVPTHDHAETLDIAVTSALHQSVQDLEVIIVGDGVTDAVRAVALGLVDLDPRVRFLDLPKGEHHGEAHRDRAVLDARSDAVFYLCDDDLLLPHHVSSLLALLADHDLVHSLNGCFAPDGSFTPYFSDLSSDAFRLSLDHPARNAVSVTGTAHTLQAYRRLTVGWEIPPPGRWTDHFLWLKLLALPGLRAATSDEVTALQLPTHQDGRESWTPLQRRAELQRWAELADDPHASTALQDSVRAGLNRAGAALWVEHYRQADLAHELRQHLEITNGLLMSTQDEVRAAQAAAAKAEAELAVEHVRRSGVEATLAAVQGTRTWRARTRLVRNPLVAGLARRTRRRA